MHAEGVRGSSYNRSLMSLIGVPRSINRVGSPAAGLARRLGDAIADSSGMMANHQPQVSGTPQRTRPHRLGLSSPAATP